MYLLCLQRILAAERAGDVDPARAFLLANLVETYLPVTVEERDELRVELEQERGVGMDATALEWAQQLFREKGVRTRRDDVRRLVQLKFGRVAPELEAVINAPETEDALSALFDLVFAAQSERDLLS